MSATNVNENTSRPASIGLSFSRRDFVKTGAAAAAGFAFMGSGNFAYAGGAETLRYGLIGCGGRGTGAIANAVEADPSVVLVAMGDLFEDHLDESTSKLTKEIGAAYQVSDESKFVGWDAFQHVIDSEVDVVILATPPVFRPEHLRYAVDKGRHVFMEKPVAIDPVGARGVMDVGEIAAQKSLSIVAGTQRRHEKQYLETVGRIHDGMMGEVIAGQVYWNQGALWKIDRMPGWSDMEHHVRNWLYYTHLSGDHVVEQHIHNIDVANWVLQANPVRAVGVGGRQARVSPDYGYVFDHFAVDLEYPSGARILSMCRQQEGTAAHVGEHFQGTEGTSNAASWILGANTFRFEGENRNPYVQEHVDHIASIRAGEPLNEVQRMAETNLAALMVREAAYTGQEVTWDDIMASTQNLTPAVWSFDEVPILSAAVPGETELNRSPWQDVEIRASN